DVLSALKQDAYDLVDTIDALYQSMDNSLRFPAETPPAKNGAAIPAQSSETAHIHVERDYRTVACPMNFVKVKLDLDGMETGQRLAVLLADGEPIDNVPRSVAAEGHKVLGQTRVGDIWRVVIEKAAD
ncbi:MAG: sulfurtransferase TusA family protein, partial [Methylobacteriaceae bacterium]|nr:sulfurtransferase TusA family protein [Methylobacteriaceae bacterium]